MIIGQDFSFSLKTFQIETKSNAEKPSKQVSKASRQTTRKNVPKKHQKKKRYFCSFYPLTKIWRGGGMLLFEWFDLTGLDKTQHGVKIFLRNIKI